MGLDSEFIWQLLLESDLVDLSNSEQVLAAALKLINPPERELPPTPPISDTADTSDDDEVNSVDIIREREAQEKLDIHVLMLIRKIWLLLTRAIEIGDNPTITAICLREQALLIHRLLYAKNKLYSITHHMLIVIQRFIGEQCLTLSHAEQLINQAAAGGDLLARLCSIKRLLSLTEKRIPLQPVVPATVPTNKLECFHSWVNNNPLIKGQLEDITLKLPNILQRSKIDYLLALKALLKDYDSDGLDCFLKERQDVLAFLNDNITTLIDIDLRFRANWNSLDLFRHANREKMKITRFFGHNFAHDRSQSEQRVYTLLPVVLERKRSEPMPSKADENNIRRKNPRDYILDTGKSSENPDEPGIKKKPRVLKFQ